MLCQRGTQAKRAGLFANGNLLQKETAQIAPTGNSGENAFSANNFATKTPKTGTKRAKTLAKPCKLVYNDTARILGTLLWRTCHGQQDHKEVKKT